MQQLEIEYFFPLTEQIPLDLDYTVCEKPKLWTTGTLLVGNGVGLGVGSIAPTTFQFKPEPDAVGYWEVSRGVQVWRKERPNWLHQQMTKIFFGWKWEDK